MLIQPPRNYWGLTKQIGPFSNTPQDEANLALGYSNMHNQYSTIRPFQQDGSGSFITASQSPLVCPENEALPMKPKLGKRFKLSFKKLSDLIKKDKPLPKVFAIPPPPPSILVASEPDQGMLTVSEGSYTLSPLVFNPSTASGSFYIPSSNSSPSSSWSSFSSASMPSAEEAASNPPPTAPPPTSRQPGVWNPPTAPPPTAPPPTAPPPTAPPPTSPNPWTTNSNPPPYPPPLWAPATPSDPWPVGVPHGGPPPPIPSEWIINSHKPFKGNTGNPIVETIPIDVVPTDTALPPQPNPWVPTNNVKDINITSLGPGQDIVERIDAETKRTPSTEAGEDTMELDNVEALLYDQISAMVKSNLAVRTNRSRPPGVNPYPPGRPRKSTRAKKQANKRSDIGDYTSTSRTRSTGEAPPPGEAQPVSKKVTPNLKTTNPKKLVRNNEPRDFITKSHKRQKLSIITKKQAKPGITYSDILQSVSAPSGKFTITVDSKSRKSTRAKKQANPRSAMGDYTSTGRTPATPATRPTSATSTGRTPATPATRPTSASGPRKSTRAKKQANPRSAMGDYK